MIPLTVIGGFLGAGKTTLVNHLLRHATRRWGVLVNDFGAINIDAALIESRGGDTIALTNGCVCCGMGDDLGAGLARLAARTPPPEHVIIESSGVSDPRRIAQFALVEPGFNLEPIIVVADALALSAQLQDQWVEDTVRNQLSAAEVVLLNKTDLADANAVAAARRAVQAVNPGVRLAETQHAEIAEHLLQFPTTATGRFTADAPPLHQFRTWRWSPATPLDREKLRSVLSALPASVLRVKGVCRLSPGSATYALQFAWGQWTLTPTDADPLGLVAIGTPAMPDARGMTELFAQTPT